MIGIPFGYLFVSNFGKKREGRGEGRVKGKGRKEGGRREGGRREGGRREGEGGREISQVKS